MNLMLFDVFPFSLSFIFSSSPFSNILITRSYEKLLKSSVILVSESLQIICCIVFASTSLLSVLVKASKSCFRSNNLKPSKKSLPRLLESFFSWNPVETTCSPITAYHYLFCSVLAIISSNFILIVSQQIEVIQKICFHN